MSIFLEFCVSLSPKTFPLPLLHELSLFAKRSFVSTDKELSDLAILPHRSTVECGLLSRCPCDRKELADERVFRGVEGDDEIGIASTQSPLILLVLLYIGSASTLVVLDRL